MGSVAPKGGGYVDPPGSLGQVTCFFLQTKGKEEQDLGSWQTSSAHIRSQIASV